MPNINDNFLKEELTRSVGNLYPSDLCKHKIDAAISSAEMADRKKGRFHMKKLSKVAMLALFCCLFGGVGVFAGGKIVGIISSSHSYYDYKHYEDLPKAEKALGQKIMAPESLPNGYSFKGITINHLASTDKEGNKSDEKIGLIITYGKGRKELSLSIDPQMAGQQPLEKEAHQEKLVAKNHTFYYSKVENLFVPADYELSDQQKERMEKDPFFNVAYGVASPSTEFCSTVSFQEGDLIYSLLSMPSTMSQEELFHLAQAVLS